ncbi:MAG: HEPN domain-containing protein [Nanoarchaeota archaeon]|nr:HEPN domain-containing protein [Nanoarchaeota archaeon]MBU1103228.1 HEPN domain-containing protein [Nanoarchaeota archaeon]
MESQIKLYLERAENEIVLSETLFKISSDEKIQADVFSIDKETTFYSAVISHAYYCIFYSAKSYLLSKGIKTKSPREHSKTYLEFKKFAEEGVLDKELLDIYDEEFSKAEILLKIFGEERKKRGQFTYEVLPQANKTPAKESIEHGQKFFKMIYNLLREND